MIDDDLVLEEPEAEIEEVREQVVFRIGEMLLAITVRHVREILDCNGYMPLPRAPEHVLGMINLRSNFIAVVDLAQKLGRPPSREHSGSRILVLDFAQPAPDGEDLTDDAPSELIAVLTDGVVTVAELEQGGSQDLPNIGEHWDHDFICGVARLQGQPVLSLELESMLREEPSTLFFNPKHASA